MIINKIKKNGVLLINMGGPDNLNDIKPYLRKLFSDPYILNVPAFIRFFLSRLIPVLRKKKASERYKLIGSKSPLKEETEKQVQELQKLLDIPVFFSMRYTDPSVKNVFIDIEKAGLNHIIVIPLYPQYSYSTTLSAIDDFKNNKPEHISYNIIQTHYQSPEFIEAHCSLLKAQIEKADKNLKSEILFVAHSIPIKQIKSGDPYVENIRETTTLIIEKLKPEIPSRLAYQSKLGPVKWQGPSMSEELNDMLRNGVEQLIVHPVSFVSENLETLYDLDIELKNECKVKGLKKYIRVPALGVNPFYIGALASLVKKEIKSKRI